MATDPLAAGGKLTDWQEVDDTTAAIKAKQAELDDLYRRRVNAYRALTGAGVTIAAIARHLGCNPRGIKLAMEAKRSAES